MGNSKRPLEAEGESLGALLGPGSQTLLSQDWTWLLLSGILQDSGLTSPHRIVRRVVV